MYTLGQNWDEIFEICWHGLKNNPDDELLRNVMKVLMDYDNKYGIKYTIKAGTINLKEK